MGSVAPRAATGLECYRALCARSQKLFAGGSAPAPWVTFLCLSKEKSPKEMTPRSRRRLPALLAGIGARLTRRAPNTRLGLKHEARCRGDDSNVAGAEPPAISFSNRARSACSILL